MNRSRHNVWTLCINLVVLLNMRERERERISRKKSNKWSYIQFTSQKNVRTLFFSHLFGSSLSVLALPLLLLCLSFRVSELAFQIVFPVLLEIFLFFCAIYLSWHRIQSFLAAFVDRTKLLYGRADSAHRTITTIPIYPMNLNSTKTNTKLCVIPKYIYLFLCMQGDGLLKFKKPKRTTTPQQQQQKSQEEEAEQKKNGWNHKNIQYINFIDIYDCFSRSRRLLPGFRCDQFEARI